MSSTFIRKRPPLHSMRLENGSGFSKDCKGSALDCLTHAYERVRVHTSEGRDKDRLFTSDYFAGVLQVVQRFFAGYLQSGFHISTFPVILCHFHSISAIRKKNPVTE